LRFHLPTVIDVTCFQQALEFANHYFHFIFIIYIPPANYRYCFFHYRSTTRQQTSLLANRQFHIKFVVTMLLKAADINNRVVSDSVTLGFQTRRENAAESGRPWDKVVCLV